MAILSSGQQFGHYTVDDFIKDGEYNESYKIKDESGKFYFLKIFDPSRIPSEVFNSEGEIQEIHLVERVSHPNVIDFVTKGVYNKDDVEYPYIVTSFFAGCLLADPLSKGRVFPLEKVLTIAKGALTGLTYLHSKGLTHNDITPRNIMYNPKNLEEVEIIDMGHLTEASNGCPSFLTRDLTAFFRAPETYSGASDARSDVYSMAAVIYAMLFGRAPWEIDLSSMPDKKSEEEAVLDAIKDRLSFSGSLDGCPDWLQKVLKACLTEDPDSRVQDSETFLKAVENRAFTHVRTAPAKQGATPEKSVRTTTIAKGGQYEIKKKAGNGFADVAGMDDIKAMLQQKVIFLFKNPDQAVKYKLSAPNGMLLYGPPGCGKTFFAEKFAEEAGLNYIFVKGSDVGSTYIHGSQGKIAELFTEAESKSPSVICFDEFDAMVPQRAGGEAHALMNPEVNEFLSQMNNCSTRGIFIIGTTNHKELIDQAVLRKGRMDLHVLVPAPDFETRKRMFDLYLKDRPCDGTDSSELAKLTDNYSSSDIAYIVNDAALVAAYKNIPISQQLLIDTIKANPSSLGPASTEPERRKIGFK